MSVEQNHKNQTVLLDESYQFAKDVNSRRNGVLAKFINQRAGRVCTKNPKQSDLLNQAKLIQSELDELIENIELCNLEEMRDALGDILVTAYGFEGLIPINIDRDYRIDVEANLSRIDVTYEDAKITQQKYLDNGVETEIHIVELFHKSFFPVRTINETQIGLNGEKFTPNKFAKSHNFRQPVYPQLADIDGDEIHIEFIKDIEDKFVLQNTQQSHDGSHIAFWKKGNCGYTANLEEAKQFTLQEANEILDDHHDGKFKLWNYKEIIKMAETKVHVYKTYKDNK